jgi:UDP-N-acetylglucosamine 3-dehydrogenase
LKSLVFNVGLIGYGAMGQNHTRVLNSMPETQLVGIYDSLSSSVDPIFKNLKCESIENLVKNRPDYCVIATPTHTHLEIADYLARNKINFLIEKPIAPDLKSAEQIMNLVSTYNVKAAVGHIERFNAAMIEARKRIKANQLGRILQIITIRQGPLPIRVEDVGVTLDLATHDIDSIMWLTESTFSRIAAQRIFRNGRKFEDGVFILGELSSGVKISSTVNWISPLKERKTMIVGERGTFVIDTLQSTLTFYENGIIDLSGELVSQFIGVSQGNVYQYAFEKTEALKTEHRSMIEFLKGNGSNVCSLNEARKVIEVTQAIFESDRLNMVVII